MIQETSALLLDKKDLTSAQMESVMEEIMSGQAQTPDIVLFLSALSEKGETVDEITAAVKVMRQHVTRISVNTQVILDTCGTGGDKKGTFNVSTAAAFVASACGVTVAKHGNRSVSSSCGSADILEALGVKIDLSKEKLEQCLKEVGIAFLFAQALHPAMKYAMPARKSIGKRTIFNILGPLTNPASATHQLLGVFDMKLVEPLAVVANNLKTAHTLVVHGEGGYDEATTTGSTFVAEAYRGNIMTYRIHPEVFGLKKAKEEDLLGGDIERNVRIIKEVLEGTLGPCRDMVVLNSACALYAADNVPSIKEGVAAAKQCLDSKRALAKLEQLKEYTNL